MRPTSVLRRSCATLLIALCAGLGLCLAQTTFQRIYKTAGEAWADAVQQTLDGGYIIVGYNNSSSTGYHADVYMVKVDPSGDIQWTKTYGGSDSDYGRSVRQTSDGGYVIVGETYSFGAGRGDVYLIKTDSAGNPLWTRTYGSAQAEEGTSMELTPDGGYIIVGSTFSFVSNHADVYLIRTNPLGDSLWTRTYGGPSSTWGTSIQITSDGGYVFVANTISSGIYLVRTDSAGDTLWTRELGGPTTAMSVQQTSNGGYIITGSTPTPSEVDVYLLKTDPSGDTVWTKTYGSGSGSSVQQTSDGGYIVAGSTFSTLFHLSNAYLLKTNSSGDTLWTRTFGGSQYNLQGRSVQQTSDGGYIIAGPAQGSERGIFLVKTQAEGLVLSVQNDPSVVPMAFGLEQNYPNPFNPSTTIRYALPHRSHVTLTVFSILGQQITTLVNGDIDAGYHTVQFDGSDLASGVYLYRMQAGSFVETRKLILMK